MSKPDSLIDGSETVPTASAASAGAAGANGSQAAEGTSPLIIPTYLFYVKIEGEVVALFSECSGIGAKRGFEEFHEGGLNDHKHVLPGVVEHTHITLKRGMSTSRVLWDWFMSGGIDFAVKRYTVTIIQAAPGKDNKHGVVKTWNLARALPVSWSLSELNTGAASLAIESLELAHEGLTLQ